MISSLAWVNGPAKSKPELYQPTPEELARHRNSAFIEGSLSTLKNKNALEDEVVIQENNQILNSNTNNGSTDLSDMDPELAAALKMDDYDNEPTEIDGVPIGFRGHTIYGEDTNQFIRLPESEREGMGEEEYDEDDELNDEGEGLSPKIKNRDGLRPGEAYPDVLADEEDDEELDDFTIRPSDALIVGAHSDQEFSHLQVYLYEESEPNMYVHHEILLPAPPLSLAWTNFNPRTPNEPSNTVAVGSFQPGIEIWNLDVIEALEPEFTLGGLAPLSVQPESVQAAVADDAMEANLSKTQKKNRKKRAKAKKSAPIEPSLKLGSHTDAVLSLSWNAQQRNLLASGSADMTVKLWDMSLASNSNIEGETPLKKTWTAIHEAPIQSLSWHPTVATVIATGSMDGTATVFDVRTENSYNRYSFGGVEIESVCWNPNDSNQLFVATEAGSIFVHDIRTGSSGGATDHPPLFSIAAHERSVSSLSFSPGIPNLMATASTDRTVKLWDLTNNKPSCIASRTTHDLGGLFSCSWYGKSPYLLALGGSKGKLAIWDIRENAGLRKKYGSLPSFGASKTPEALLSSSKYTTIIGGTEHDDMGEYSDDDDDDDDDHNSRAVIHDDDSSDSDWVTDEEDDLEELNPEGNASFDSIDLQEEELQDMMEEDANGMTVQKKKKKSSKKSKSKESAKNATPVANAVEDLIKAHGVESTQTAEVKKSSKKKKKKGKKNK